MLRALLFAYLISILPTAQARWLLPKEVGSVIEKYEIESDVNKDGSFTQTVTYVIRVQGEDAKVSAGLIPIEYNSFTEKVDILDAYTLNGKEKTPVDPSAIEDRDKGESKAYDAMKVRSVAFPQVAIGSRLYLKYRTNWSKPVMEGRWSEDMALPPQSFIENFRYRVKAAMPLYLELTDPRGLISKKQVSPSEYIFTNKKIIPGWVHGEKEPFFHPGGDTHIRVSSHKNWVEFYEDLNKDYAKVQNAPLPKSLHSWVSAAKKKKEPKLQILKVMSQMSHDLRYFGDWRRHNGGIVPRELAEIEKSRYGDCKDLATLLTAMLRALNIEADVALVRRGENAWGYEPDYALPDLNRFNHAIVRAKVGNETYWLDATNPVAWVEPFPDIAGRPAWIMQAGNGHFERLPSAESKNYVFHHEYEYNFKTMDEVKVNVTANFKHMAPYHLATQLMLLPRSEVLSDALEYFTEGQELKNFRYLTEPSTLRTLGDMKFALEYQAGRVTFDAGKDAFYVIPDGFLTGPFYETEDRESDLRLAEIPFTHEAVRRLKNAKLVQQKPEPCRLQSEWMDLERKVEVEGKDVVIYQNVNLKKPHITREEFRSPGFRKLQKGTRGCFYRSGVLVESLTGAL